MFKMNFAHLCLCLSILLAPLPSNAKETLTYKQFADCVGLEVKIRALEDEEIPLMKRVDYLRDTFHRIKRSQKKTTNEQRYWDLQAKAEDVRYEHKDKAGRLKSVQEGLKWRDSRFESRCARKRVSTDPRGRGLCKSADAAPTDMCEAYESAVKRAAQKKKREQAERAAQQAASQKERERQEETAIEAQKSQESAPLSVGQVLSQLNETDELCYKAEFRETKTCEAWFDDPQLSDAMASLEIKHIESGGSDAWKTAPADAALLGLYAKAMQIAETAKKMAPTK